MTQSVTLEEIRTWPAAVDLPDAADAYGISRAQAYVAAKRGDFPARVIKVGRRLKVVTADILRDLSPEADDRHVIARNAGTAA